MLNDILPSKSTKLTPTNLFKNNAEYTSEVIVHSSAHNFQLNKLQYGLVFEEAEGSVSKKKCFGNSVRYVKLISSMVSELVLLHVH